MSSIEKVQIGFVGLPSVCKAEVEAARKGQLAYDRDKGKERVSYRLFPWSVVVARYSSLSSRLILPQILSRLLDKVLAHKARDAGAGCILVLPHIVELRRNKQNNVVGSDS